MSLLSVFKKKKEDVEEKNLPLFPEFEKLKAEIEGNRQDIPTTPQIQQQEEISTNPPFQETMPQQFPPEQQIPFAPMQQPLQTTPQIPQITQQQMESLPETQKSIAESKEQELIEEKPELYIKIDKYKEVVSLLDKLKIKLKDIESTLEKLKEINEQEKSDLDEWKSQLEDAKDKVDNVLDLLRE